MTGAQVYRYTSIKWVHTGIAVDSSWGYDAAAYQQLYQAQIKRFFRYDTLFSSRMTGYDSGWLSLYDLPMRLKYARFLDELRSAQHYCTSTQEENNLLYKPSWEVLC